MDLDKEIILETLIRHNSLINLKNYNKVEKILNLIKKEDKNCLLFDKIQLHTDLISSKIIMMALKEKKTTKKRIKENFILIHTYEFLKKNKQALLKFNTKEDFNELKEILNKKKEIELKKLISSKK